MASYSDYYIRSLINEALRAYNGIPLQSRELSVPEVKGKFMCYEEYPLFLEPVDRLVEMGELDFNAASSLEEVVEILRKKP